MGRLNNVLRKRKAGERENIASHADASERKHTRVADTQGEASRTNVLLEQDINSPARRRRINTYQQTDRNSYEIESFSVNESLLPASPSSKSMIVSSNASKIETPSRPNNSVMLFSRRSRRSSGASALARCSSVLSNTVNPTEQCASSALDGTIRLLRKSGRRFQRYYPSRSNSYVVTSVTETHRSFAVKTPSSLARDALTSCQNEKACLLPPDLLEQPCKSDLPSLMSSPYESASRKYQHTTEIADDFCQNCPASLLPSQCAESPQGLKRSNPNRFLPKKGSSKLKVLDVGSTIKEARPEPRVAAVMAISKNTWLLQQQQMQNDYRKLHNGNIISGEAGIHQDYRRQESMSLSVGTIALADNNGERSSRNDHDSNSDVDSGFVADSSSDGAVSTEDRHQCPLRMAQPSTRGGTWAFRGRVVAAQVLPREDELLMARMAAAGGPDFRRGRHCRIPNPCNTICHLYEQCEKLNLQLILSDDLGINA